MSFAELVIPLTTSLLNGMAKGVFQSQNVTAAIVQWCECFRMTCCLQFVVC